MSKLVDFSVSKLENRFERCKIISSKAKRSGGYTLEIKGKGKGVRLALMQMHVFQE